MLIKEENEFFLNPFFAPIDENGNRVEKVSDSDVDQIVKNLVIAIGNLVIGNYSYEHNSDCHWMEKYSAMIQLIHSELDADNLDYLLRDATFSGTSYGIMDMGLLLNCLYVEKITYNFSGKDACCSERYIVGITKKGMGAVEQFLLGKFMAYRQMILSKYVSVLEAMIYRVESEYIIPDDTSYSGSRLLEMVGKKQTEIDYLRFSDFYVFDKLYSLAEFRGLRRLARAIISRLRNSCAFDLDESGETECICVGTNAEEIMNEFKNNQLYNQFIIDYNSLKNKSGKELSEEDEVKLFSYRFEEYALTKQIPIDEFEDKFLFSAMKASRRYNFHYYRLGNGIPILDPPKKYCYSEIEKGKPDREKIPELCVDSPLSALKDLREMKFVALRKYKICKYTPGE